MRYLCLALLLYGCTTTDIRTDAVFGVDFSDQAPRLLIDLECNGHRVLQRGIATCEERSNSLAKATIKVPPLEGRMVYSNGDFKKTEDFNWYPEEGFFIWRKRPIKDTWIQLNMAEMAPEAGDNPISVEVSGIDKKNGVISSRGIFYHRVCDDLATPCSKVVVAQECRGIYQEANEGEIGSCDLMVGSSHKLMVKVDGPSYKVTGGKLYVAAARISLGRSIDVKESDLLQGYVVVDIPSVPKGAMLVSLRFVWQSGLERKEANGKVLLHGTVPEWTPMDDPHVYQRESKKPLAFVMPVLGDLLEVIAYHGETVATRYYTTDKMIPLNPAPFTKVCAYAWQRSNLDLTYVCVDKNGAETKEVSHGI